MVGQDIIARDFSNSGDAQVYRLFFMANGYHYSSNNKNTNKQQQAIDIALRVGLSKCHSYLKAKGLKPSQYRLKQLSADSPVRILSSEPIDAGFQGNNLNGARIIGEIQYVLSNVTDSLNPEILHVDIASNKNQYQAGESIYFKIKALTCKKWSL